MRKHLCFLLLTTLAMSVLAFGLRLHLEQRRLAAGLIRLHVTAASDAEEDQQAKLRVRDAVLPVIESLTRDSADADAARAALLAGLPAIRAAAEAALQKPTPEETEEHDPEAPFRRAAPAPDTRSAQAPDPAASSAQTVRRTSRADEAPVSVSLTEELFPMRVYDTFTLPAGRYTSLRVTLGAGEGHNWWCVAFPALCLPATAEGFEDAARTAGLDNGQILLLTSDDESVRIKFRILDWLETLFG